MPAAIANAPSANAYAPQRNTRAVRVICGHTNARTPNAIAARPRNTNAHQLLVYTTNIGFLLVQLFNRPTIVLRHPQLLRSLLFWTRLSTDQRRLHVSVASVVPPF